MTLRFNDCGIIGLRKAYVESQNSHLIHIVIVFVESSLNVIHGLLFKAGPIPVLVFEIMINNGHRTLVQFAMNRYMRRRKAMTEKNVAVVDQLS